MNCSNSRQKGGTPFIKWRWSGPTSVKRDMAVSMGRVLTVPHQPQPHWHPRRYGLLPRDVSQNTRYCRSALDTKLFLQWPTPERVGL